MGCPSGLVGNLVMAHYCHAPQSAQQPVFELALTGLTAFSAQSTHHFRGIMQYYPPGGLIQTLAETEQQLACCSPSHIPANRNEGRAN